MASIFEKTMGLCLENKRIEPVAPGSKRTLTEKKALLKEQEDYMNDELGLTEPEIDPFDAEMAEMEGEDDSVVEMGDIEDDVVVVIDPELPEDAGEEGAEDLPPVEEYVGDFTYRCPVCGNTFITADEMHDGDECPVCGDFPSEFELVGEIAPAEDVVEDETAEEPAEDAPVDEPIDEAAEDAEDDVAADEPIEDEEVEEESLNVSMDKAVKERAVKPRARRALQLDEKAFNRHLTHFIREHYSNAASFKIVDAKISADRKLTFECNLTMKSGKVQKVELVSEKFSPNSTMYIKMRDNGTFKTESSKKAPFIFKCNLNNNVITCEGMKFNFITVAEGKRAQIYGKYMTEACGRGTKKISYTKRKR